MRTETEIRQRLIGYRRINRIADPPGAGLESSLQVQINSLEWVLGEPEEAKVPAAKPKGVTETTIELSRAIADLVDSTRSAQVRFGDLEFGRALNLLDKVRAEIDRVRSW